MQDPKKESFTGSKGGSGVKEFIINHIPQCEIFYEGFAGKAIISETLLNCGANIKRIVCTEVNPKTYFDLSKKLKHPKVITWLGDFIKMINRETELGLNSKIFYKETDCFYFDPPYRMDSRSHKREYYGDFDWDDNAHKSFFKLVEMLNNAGSKILISHYPDPIYDEQFKEWNKEDFRTRTRTVTERLYWNFDLNAHSLATTEFLGNDFTDRQRIKRKVERMTAKINSLPRHERQAIVESLLKTYEC